MTKRKRKIGFYYLTLNNEDLDIQNSLALVLEHIRGLDKIIRRKIILGNKFGLLDSINSINEGINYQVIFKSATHDYRPPLLDNESVEERDNPKHWGEGESNKTHILTRSVNGDVVLLLEKFQDGLSVKQLIKYLNLLALTMEVETPIVFRLETIIKDDFLEELDKLERVYSADLFVDKQILGGDALNYSDRTRTIQNTITVSVKAERMKSVADFVEDAYLLFSGGKEKIKKIRLHGKNEENNIVVLNTDVIDRQEYVNPTINETTGEILSNEIFQEMQVIINSF